MALLVPETSPTSRKPTTRHALLARRDAVSETERAARGAKISERAVALIEHRIKPGSVVALYAAKGSEVDTIAIDEGARARGFVVAYPRVIGDARELAFHAA
ncbi:MAG TPA: hypothetical protein VN253_15410, partial [Kofleriaceae bacterium]|nr:hypothetical protein [Kofleriaceae bacterium]